MCAAAVLWLCSVGMTTQHSFQLTNELQQLAALREVAGVELVPVHHGGGRGGEAGGQQLQRVEHLVRHRDVRQPRQQLGEHLVVPAARHADGAQPGVGLPQAPANDALAIKNIFFNCHLSYLAYSLLIWLATIKTVS